MLAQKVDKKKIFEYSAILGVIFLIIAYIIVTNFVIKPNSGADEKAAGSIISIPIKDIKELDMEAINAPKFQELKENVYIETKIEDLDVGKKDPFTPPELKKTKIID